MARTKISKAAKDFNVSTETVVGFLRKHGRDIDDGNPNYRIEEEDYRLLEQNFMTYRRAKEDAVTQMATSRKDRDKEKETKPEAQPEQAVPANPPTSPIKIVGHIDLDAHNKPIRKSQETQKQSPKNEPKKAETKKPEAANTERRTQVATPQTSATVKSTTPAAKPETKTKPANTPATGAINEMKKEAVSTSRPTTPAPQTKEPRTDKTPESTPGVKAVSDNQTSTPKATDTPPGNNMEKASVNTTPAHTPAKEPAKAATAGEPEVFSVGVPPVGPRLNVIGKIDLSALNQSTRPKKKSKEERRRERIDSRNSNGGQSAQSTQQGGGQSSANGDRKKRRRINGKEKVDIEGAAQQNNDNQRDNRGKGGSNNQGGERGGRRGSNDRNNDRNNRNDRGGRGNRNDRDKRPVHTEVSEEDVQKQVKETLARLTSKDKGQKKGAKWRKEKREAYQSREREAHEHEQEESRVLKLTEFVTVNDLATMMKVPVNSVITTLWNLGMIVSINQRLDAEYINVVAEEFGFTTEYVAADVVEAIHVEEDKEDDLQSRPPIVTVMGHVDHGKTSLLDYIRNANVIAGEAGGITQHIGAYNVKFADGRHITFLDTPGHEAFTAMRARGAKVTDLCIIIVAADDNVMPQTVEAINHASAAGVPIVFAINKIDKPAANPDKIKEELAQMNYLVEDWGGKYQSQDISAKKGIGVEELMEKVLLEAEMLELKANPNRAAIGSVIESSLDKGRGYVATVLVQNGTLRIGDVILAGTNYGKVKAMFNERNQRVKEAGPATPVLILGLNGAPQAGDTFNVMDTEQEAREIANKREQLQREQQQRTTTRLTLEDIGRRRAIGNFQELNLIVKGDVDGSIEALSDSLIKLSTEEIKVNVLHKAVGEISESDVSLAAASDAIIIGFQVRPSMLARRSAERDGVEIRLYSVIYQAIEEVKDAMEGMLAPEIKEEVIGTAEVLQTYHISKVGTIAGCIVREGKIKRGCKVRLIRDGIVKYTGELGSLKRFKDDAKEVVSGYDCGMSIAGYNDIHEGDFIEAFEEVEVKKTLS